jgi:hypothetical protein
MGRCPSFHLKAETDPLSETFCSLGNTRQWAKFTNPIILSVVLLFNNHRKIIKVSKTN